MASELLDAQLPLTLQPPPLGHIVAGEEDEEEDVADGLGLRSGAVGSRVQGSAGRVVVLLPDMMLSTSGGGEGGGGGGGSGGSIRGSSATTPRPKSGSVGGQMPVSSGAASTYQSEGLMAVDGDGDGDDIDDDDSDVRIRQLKFELSDLDDAAEAQDSNSSGEVWLEFDGSPEGESKLPAERQALRRQWRKFAAKSRAANGTVDYDRLLPTPTDEDIRIRKDMDRTLTGFSDCVQPYRMTAPGVRIMAAVERVLHAVAVVDTELGYCQGMNFIACLAVREVGEETAFWLCLCLFRQRNLRFLFLPDVPVLSLYLIQFDETVQRKMPKLHAHFQLQSFMPFMYAMEWFTTLFITAADVSISRLAVSLLLSGADNALFRIGLSILQHLDADIMALDSEGLMTKFKSLVMTVDADEIAMLATGYDPYPDVLTSLIQPPAAADPIKRAASLLATPQIKSPAKTLRRRRAGSAVVYDKKQWLAHARSTQLKRQHGAPYGKLVHEQSVASVAISLDTARTFEDSDKAQFADDACGSPDALPHTLERVLRALAVVDSAVGYCQGMNFVVGFLLQEVGEESCFWLSRCLFETHHFSALYEKGAHILSQYLKCFNNYMAVHVPAVHAHLMHSDYAPEFYAAEWFQTMYINTLSREAVRLVLTMIFDGYDNVLFRVGAAIMTVAQEQIIAMSRVDLLENFKAIPFRLPISVIMDEALSFPVCDDVLAKLCTSPGDRTVVSMSFQRPRLAHSVSVLRLSASRVPESDEIESLPQHAREALRSTPMNELRVDVLEHRRINNIVVYVISVGAQEEKWQVLRRYQSFHDLHELLQAELDGSYVPLPTLPGKKWWVWHDEEFYRNRGAELHLYLKALVRCPGLEGNPHLRQFFSASDV